MNSVTAARPASPSSWAKAYGPVALVTGASDGIGRAFSLEIAKRGLDLVLVARRGDALRALSHEIEATYGVSAIAIQQDLSVSKNIDDLVEALRGMDITLFVPAAGFGTSGNFVDSRIDDELNMIDLNCRSVVQMTRPIAEAMARRRRGGIVLLSSIVAFQGVPRAATYAATKAFVQTFAESIRAELKTYRVHVLACAPGPVRSGFAARAGMTMGLSHSPDQIAAETLDALGAMTTVRPGWISKLLGHSLGVLPRFARVRIMKSVMAGMTASNR